MFGSVPYCSHPVLYTFVSVTLCSLLVLQVELVHGEELLQEDVHGSGQSPFSVPSS
jgi:hypothetical protein